MAFVLILIVLYVYVMARTSAAILDHEVEVLCLDDVQKFQIWSLWNHWGTIVTAHVYLLLGFLYVKKKQGAMLLLYWLWAFGKLLNFSTS